MLHADQQPLRHRRQGLGGHAYRQAGLLADEAVDPPQERPAAAKDHAVIDQVGRQIGAAMIDRGLDRLDDLLQGIAEGLADFFAGDGGPAG